jgi:hypothetical protein
MVFEETVPSLNNYWRAITLFGQNLLELGGREKTFISMEDLAEPFAKHIVGQLSLRRARTHYSFDGRKQFVQINRLRYIGIHSGLQAQFLVALHSAGGHGDYGKMGPGVTLPLTNDGRGLKPVHVRHLNVH